MPLSILKSVRSNDSGSNRNFVFSINLRIPCLIYFYTLNIAQTACVCTIEIRYSVINHEYTHGEQIKKIKKI